jgi:hypothetical protein
VVEINNYYGDNNQILFKNVGLNVEKVSAQLYRVKRVFAAGEQVSYLWSEAYRR